MSARSVSYSLLDARFKKLRALVAQTGPGGGGGPLPLTRFKFLDTGTSVAAPAQDGSIGKPFSSLANFSTKIGTGTSKADNLENMVAMLCPPTIIVGGATPVYNESFAFTPYRNEELRADSIPVILNGNVTGANTLAGAGGNPAFAPQIAIWALHNVSVTGNVTLTDDGSIEGELAISGDEGLPVPNNGEPLITGDINLVGTTRFISAAVTNFHVAGNCLALGSQVVWSFTGASIDGSVQGKNLAGVGTVFSGAAFQVAAGQNATFLRCTFQGVAPVFTGGAGTTVTFDPYSYASFLEAGGTFAGGAVAVVVGVPTLKGTTPGVGIGETIELKFGGTLPFELEDNKAYTIRLSVIALGLIGAVRTAQSFDVLVTAHKEAGVTTISASGTVTQQGDAGGATWSITPTVGAAPDRIVFTFSTGATTAQTVVEGSLSLTSALL